MPIQPFEYHAPESLSEAVEMLTRCGSEAKVLAGGTDLTPALKARTIRPRTVISLHAVKELNYIEREDGFLRVGALATHADLAESPLVKETAPVLARACGLIGSWQIRNIGTIGGNLCNASPVADTAGPLYSLDASVALRGAGGDREMAIENFFIAPGAAALESGELLREIRLPVPGPGSAGCYLKLMRRKALDLALAAVTIQVEPNPGAGAIAKAAITLGGVAPTPIRARAAEALLNGLSYADAMKAAPEAASVAAAATSPISDVRASAEYRRAITETYVAKGLAAVLETLSKRA
ncbi:MAG: xanthine dehydrogenase family protein subunit M [Desulfobacterales bacterium]|nr:xanthine dehydrogenase family protein subunit M [Desulfobacterales bacterium]